MTLEDKIHEAEEALRTAAKISKQYYQKPLIITYSGGKDSDVMLDIALHCLKPDEFEVLNSHTTLDAPETVYYIRERFAELEKQGVTCTVKYPTYRGKRTDFWRLVAEKGLPTRLMRYCCQVLKETSAPNRFIAIGVRESESQKRKGRDLFSNWARVYSEAVYYSLDHVKEVYEEAQEKDEVWDCIFIQKAKRNDDLIVNPIYHFTESDVWTYIRDRELKYNPLYDQGYLRVGCIGCPLGGSASMRRSWARHPIYKHNLLLAIQRYLDRRHTEGKHFKNGKDKDAESLFRWWTEDETIEGQMTLDDYLEEEQE